MMQQWEYTQVSAHVNDIAGLVQQANDYGSYGWEVVGFASADKTLGLNSVMAVLKRPIDPLPAPDGHDAGWKPDPSCRWHLRYWDGAVWRHDVESSFDGKVVKGRDAPTLRAAYRVPPWEEVY